MSLLKKICVVLGALSMASAAFAAGPPTHIAVTGNGAAGAFSLDDYVSKGVTTAANTSFAYSLDFSLAGPDALVIDLTR
jgi:hypothetical protein